MTKWLTIKEMPDRYSFLTEATIRGLIKNAENNGFKVALRRIANKTLIDQEQFEDWLNNQRWKKSAYRTKNAKSNENISQNEDNLC